MSKRNEEKKSCLYKLDGSETLGSYLRVQPCSEEVPTISKCSFQWYRLSSEGSWREVISGITKMVHLFILLLFFIFFMFPDYVVLEVHIPPYRA